MKRLWMRAHAVPNVEDVARHFGFTQDATILHQRTLQPGWFKHANDMLVIEVSDDLAARVARDGFLMASGKVLAEGEEPPYVGEGKG